MIKKTNKRVTITLPQGITEKLNTKDLARIIIIFAEYYLANKQESNQLKE